MLALQTYLSHRQIFKSKKKDAGIINIVFIVYMPQSWNSLKPVYLAAEKNPRVRTFLIVLPFEIIKGDGSIITSYEFWEKEYPGKVIRANTGTQLVDIKTFEPDIVFRQTSYDEMYPKEYSYFKIAKYAKTCYVPYNYNFSPFKHLLTEYQEKYLRSIYAIFTDNRHNAEYLLEKKKKIRWYKELHIYNLGFSRFDLYPESRDVSLLENSNRGCRHFTWIPRWAIESAYNDPTGFFHYKDKLLFYFNNHQELYLTIRPHPNMFSHFEKTGAMSKQEIEDFRKNIRELKNISLDDELDYIETFRRTDVLIADMSSLNVEFFITGKPVIYCGDENECNDEVRGMFELFYKVEGWDDLKKWLDNLSSGSDPYKNARYKVIETFMNGIPGNIGDAIINKCLEFVQGV